MHFKETSLPYLVIKFYYMKSRTYGHYSQKFESESDALSPSKKENCMTLMGLNIKASGRRNPLDPLSHRLTPRKGSVCLFWPDESVKDENSNSLSYNQSRTLIVRHLTILGKITCWLTCIINDFKWTFLVRNSENAMFLRKKKRKITLNPFLDHRWLVDVSPKDIYPSQLDSSLSAENNSLTSS